MEGHQERDDQVSAAAKQAAGPAPEEALVGGAPPGMDRRDVEGRSELARWLQPHVFPAPADRLVESAAETHAPDRIMGLLKALPQDRVYRNVQEVWQALGGGTEDVSRRT